jgi:sugar/nucleoside kinase (ribokinase family)
MALDVVSLGVLCADVMVRPVEKFPPRGQLELVPKLEIHLGGLAAVTATLLCQLGAKAGVIGRLGNDGFGDYIVGALQASGVHTERLQRIAGANTSATVVLISEDGERTFLHHVGTNAQVTEADVDLAFIKQARIFHWGGPSICPGIDGAPIGRIMKAAKEAGVMTSMDTMYDGRGVWFPHIEHALPHLDIIMSSIEEARKYSGKQDPEDIADFFLTRGPKTALIKLGAEGIFAKNSREKHRIPAHRVSVIDTTGAGDAACGGFLYGVLQGWDLKKCAQLANAVGGLTVQTMGGGEAVKSLSQVLAFMENKNA